MVYNQTMKTILITGISRGIGKALAKKFLDENHIVIGTSLTGIIDFSHDKLTAYRLDLTSSRSVQTCAKSIEKEIKKSDTQIDILINNAGALFDEDETHVIIDKLRQTLEVNLIGTIDFTEHLIPSMNKGGHILNVSSSAGSLGGKSLTEIEFANSSHFPFHYPAYKISKTALNMYTRTLAARFINEKTHIIVSSVHPGWVKTDMGGPEAEMSPEESAEYIYKLAISQPETGQFWFKGEKYPW